MKTRFATVLLTLSLAACTTGNQARQEAPPFPQPLRPAEPLTSAPAPLSQPRPAGPPPVTSAGALTLARVGSYMDAQENELRARLRGVGGLVMRPGDDLVIVLGNNVLLDGMNVSARGDTILESIAMVLRRYDRSSIQVQGFTDTTGTPERNLSLSDARAKLVQAALVRHGVPRARVSAQGFGETRLRVVTGDNRSEPRNQRIELRIIARPG